MSSISSTLPLSPAVTQPSSARCPQSLPNLAAVPDRHGDSHIIDGHVDRDFIQRSLQALRDQRSSNWAKRGFSALAAWCYRHRPWAPNLANRLVRLHRPQVSGI